MRKRWLICAAAMCMALSCAGCSGSDDKTTTTIIEMDENGMREYRGDDAEAMSTADAEEGSKTGGQGNAYGDSMGGDSVGGIGSELGIPPVISETLSADGTELDSVTISDDDVQTLKSDKAYTKKFKASSLDAAERETLLKAIFDEESGVFNYPYDINDSVTQEQRDDIFANRGAEVDYSQDYFIGKIDGTEYILYFYNMEWSTDEGFSIQPAVSGDIPQEMADKGATSVGYEQDFEQVFTENFSDEQAEAISTASDMLANWGYADVGVTSLSPMYLTYWNEYGEVVKAEEREGCYTIEFSPTVNGQTLYQPEAFQIDTISHVSKSDYGASDSFYYVERTMYTVCITSDGLDSFNCTWPMMPEGDISDAGSLITWDEAVSALQSVIPEHFKDYVGYSAVCFNDVRLAYFRTRVGDDEYEVIPVYVFAQVDDDYSDTRPIQLVMLDARDGSEVSIMQDGDERMNMKGL